MRATRCGLTTGRLRDQWHAMSRTGTIAGLFAHEPEPRLTGIRRSFAAEIDDGDLVQILSRRAASPCRPPPTRT